MRHRFAEKVFVVVGAWFIMGAAVPAEKFSLAENMGINQFAPLADRTFTTPIVADSAVVWAPETYPIVLQEDISFFDGEWGNPVEYFRVVSSFGMRNHPILHVRKMHTGIDLVARCGTPVYAAADGQVMATEKKDSLGKQVVIFHDKTYDSVYGHLSSYAVTPNQYVLKGTVIGYAGSTGLATGCHLHFEIHMNGVPVNPLDVL